MGLLDDLRKIKKSILPPDKIELSFVLVTKSTSADALQKISLLEEQALKRQTFLLVEMHL